MKEFLKDKKKVILAAILILAIIALILWSRRQKTDKSIDESNYVEPRGFFPGGGGGLPAPSPAPTPTPSPTPTPTPTGSHHPHHPYYPNYPYYPGPVYYNPFPRTYIIDEVDEEDPSNMTRKEYIEYLRKKIIVLEAAHDRAISTLKIGKAYRISKEIDKVEAVLDKYLGL